MRNHSARIFAAVLLTLLAALPVVAQQQSYFETVFAPPTAEEIDAVYEQTLYKPQCVDFKLGDVYKQFDKGTIYKVTYKSDGLKATGMLAVPKGLKGRAPLVMMNHAGFSGIGQFDIPRIESFMNEGWVTAAATYRGEAGEAGESEGEMDVLGDELHDILNLMECALARDDVDPSKIAFFGASHGGGLTVSALSRTGGRVKAAATVSAPLSLMSERIKTLAADWRTFPARTEVIMQVLMPKKGIAKMKKLLGIKEQSLDVVPAVRREMMRRSASLFADKITTPIIMFMGDQDPVVWPADAQAVEKSLTARGIFAKAAVLADRSHAPSPSDMVEIDRAIIEFFREKLK